MRTKRIPISSSHVKYIHEDGKRRTIGLENHGDVINLQMNRGGPNDIIIPMSPIEVTELREALLLLPKLPKSRCFIFYRRSGK